MAASSPPPPTPDQSESPNKKGSIDRSIGPSHDTQPAAPPTVRPTDRSHRRERPGPPPCLPRPMGGVGSRVGSGLRRSIQKGGGFCRPRPRRTPQSNGPPRLLCLCVWDCREDLLVGMGGMCAVDRFGVKNWGGAPPCGNTTDQTRDGRLPGSGHDRPGGRDDIPGLRRSIVGRGGVLRHRKMKGTAAHAMPDRRLGWGKRIEGGVGVWLCICVYVSHTKARGRAPPFA